jgi:hypothetical protein
MRRRNAQTNDRQLIPVPPLQTPRGLELIKSSAKFYANGVGAAKPTIQLSYPVRAASNNPAAERALSSPVGKLSVRAIAMFCLLLLVLPGLGLAAIVWCGTRMADTGAPEIVLGEASSLSARLASSVVARPNDAAQTVSNAQSDIIIHKVKTERIDGGAWADRGPR